MRTEEQIAEIKKRIGDPYSVKDLITKEEIVKLVDFFEKSNGKIYKNTGPVTLNIDFSDPMFSSIKDKIVKEIGGFTITSGFFFKTDTPFIIHNDDTHELPNGVYKGITLPLIIERDNMIEETFPKLCFFDQFYFHGPAKFFKGAKYIPTFYNTQVYNYKDVSGILKKDFDEDVRIGNHLEHLRSIWLEGLSLWGSIEWVPGNAIIFDSVRLHCASDFRKLGIKSKLGISIFTKIE